MIPPLIFAILCILISIIVHKKITNVLIACIVVGLTTSIIYQIIGVLIIGYLDPFFMFAFVVGVVVAFVISLIVRAVLDFACSRSADDDE